MNCLEFRRRTLEDPMREDTVLHAHERTCAECARFARRTREQETALRALLLAPQPPAGLAERIRLAARQQDRVARRRLPWPAAAAALVLALGVAAASLFGERIERSRMTLAQSLFDHIADEARHLHETDPEAPAQARRVLARFGARLEADIGPIAFAAECLMRRRTGVHLILRGRRGPVSVFLMPGERVAAPQPVRTEEARLAGKLLPTAWGALAVIGTDGEATGPLARRIARAVRWNGALPAFALTDAPAGVRLALAD